jgi:hypothetical protein
MDAASDTARRAYWAEQMELGYEMNPPWAGGLSRRSPKGEDGSVDRLPPGSPKGGATATSKSKLLSAIDVAPSRKSLSIHGDFAKERDRNVVS